METELSQLNSRVQLLEKELKALKYQIDSLPGRECSPSLQGKSGLPLVEVSEDDEAVTMRIFNKRGEPCIAFVCDSHGGGVAISEGSSGGALTMRAMCGSVSLTCQDGDGNVAVALTNQYGKGQLVITGPKGRPSVSLVGEAGGGAGAFYASDGTARIVLVGMDGGAQIRLGDDSGRQSLQLEAKQRSGFIHFAHAESGGVLSIEMDDDGSSLRTTVQT